MRPYIKVIDLVNVTGNDRARRPDTAGLAIARTGGAATRAERLARPPERRATGGEAVLVRSAGSRWPSWPVAGHGPPGGRARRPAPRPAPTAGPPRPGRAARAGQALGVTGGSGLAGTDHHAAPQRPAVRRCGEVRCRAGRSSPARSGVPRGSPGAAASRVPAGYLGPSWATTAMWRRCCSAHGNVTLPWFRRAAGRTTGTTRPAHRGPLQESHPCHRDPVAPRGARERRGVCVLAGV
jgi:hypothetical protein